MKTPIYVFLQFTMLLLLFSCSQSDKGHFQLCSDDETASVFIMPGEPEYVHLAAQDFISDVEKITGKKLSVVNSLEASNNNCVVIGSVDHISNDNRITQIVGDDLDVLNGQWEAYRVKNYNNAK